MIGDIVISDNEREIGTVQVFTTEGGLQGWARDSLAQGWLEFRGGFPSGYFGYVVRLAPVTRGDLVRWGLMKSARKSAEFLEDFARLVTSENPQMFITVGGETREDLYDGVLEVLSSINRKIAEEEVFDCGFTTPEEASEEGTKQLKAISRRLWYELIYEGILYECEENGIAYLDMFKILEFEAWSEAVACYFRPASERPISYFEDEND